MKTDDALSAWLDANQRALTDEIAQVRARVARHVQCAEQVTGPLMQQPAQQAPAGEGNSALDIASARLGLSSFERSIVVLCAAIELEAGFAELCAQAHGDPARPYPSFGLALAVFDDAHWSALAPSSPLRRWGLVELGRAAPITQAPLRIDEAFLHELAGVSELDARIDGYVSPLDVSAVLAPTHARVAREVAQVLAVAAPQGSTPVLQLTGNDRVGQREVATRAFAQLGFGTWALDPSILNGAADDLEARARAWQREALLRRAALFIDAHELPEIHARDGLARFVERFATPVALGTRYPLRCALRPMHLFDVTRVPRAEQVELWGTALGCTLADGPQPDAALRTAIDRVTTQFDFDSLAIATAARRARGAADDAPLAQRLWRAARVSARNELAALAQRLERRAGWAELVLPDSPLATLHEIVSHARHRSLVEDEWGVGRGDGRGLGIAALFHGPSGTGKTMAAEVLGTAMDLDVFRVDLSQLVSKYIGETEKNLSRVFDAAESSGAILLFDECDAIFGKRGEVERGQDRYANLEVSYLLQRMESYRGISILTTNLRGAIDSAFMRRLRFVVDFPFPDYAQRIAIWQRLLGSGVPVGPIDCAQLARLHVAGGSIRNIVVAAAFLAANEAGAVSMQHLRHAALAECAKLERTPSEVEIGGWT
ncbi:ATP-binding protein [Paraburkholderia sp. 35.1]|uniref:ATP-binding protein n=1 Tax=Paraburkholderia sp. 35.1 TaxID=2991058 RepID=UPI003D203832